MSVWVRLDEGLMWVWSVISMKGVDSSSLTPRSVERRGMAIVRIPFRERFRETILNGTKTCTCRTRQMAKTGDIFEAFGQQFIIEDVQEHLLLQVRDDLWEAEGCVDEQDFEQVWNDIHPRRKFQPKQLAHVHFFKKLS